VGSFARLGLVGLMLLVSLVLRVLRQIVRHRRRIASDELLVCASLLVVAILVVASLGVVLEAPFGSVPFWWAAGILLTLTGSPTRDPEATAGGRHADKNDDHAPLPATRRAVR